MTLIDTGPLVALLDRGEADHVRVAKTLGVLPGRLVTTWPVLTEAMYLMHRAGGWAGQHHLWALVLSERLEVVDLKETSMAVPARGRNEKSAWRREEALRLRSVSLWCCEPVRETESDPVEP